MTSPLLLIMNKLPKRKNNRLLTYDYKTGGYYFITICSRDRRPLFSRITVGAAICRPPYVELTPIGKIIETAIREIPAHYDGVTAGHYVIMPNHIHLLLCLETDGRQVAAPTVIGHLKRAVSARVGYTVWQKGFYDHIIRDERDYLIHLQYIENNPAKWTEDPYHTTQP